MAQSTNEVEVRGSADVSAMPASLPPADADRIRARIEETRAEISQTIDAIQARLSPSRFVREAKNSTVPLLMLAGVAATGLLVRALKRRRRHPRFLAGCGAGLACGAIWSSGLRRRHRQAGPAPPSRLLARSETLPGT